jgi:hypothetical protein
MESKTMNETESVSKIKILDAFTLLLDQWRHHKPPGAWTYCGPASKLLMLMQRAVGASCHGLPADDSVLIRWLTVPANNRALREESILVSFVPDPRGPSQRDPNRDQDDDANAWPPLIKLERAIHRDEYRDRPNQ